jgi:hypothetical protein
VNILFPLAPCAAGTSSCRTFQCSAILPLATRKISTPVASQDEKQCCEPASDTEEQHRDAPMVLGLVRMIRFHCHRLASLVLDCVADAEPHQLMPKARTPDHSANEVGPLPVVAPTLRFRDVALTAAIRGKTDAICSPRPFPPVTPRADIGIAYQKLILVLQDPHLSRYADSA